MTKLALWPERWPLVAHRVLDDGRTCVETLDQTTTDTRDETWWSLPCDDCAMSTNCLVAKRKELGPLLYDREELTRPRASESSLFPWEVFEKWVVHDEAFQPSYVKPYGVESEWAIGSAWDLAWSEKTGNDYLVRMTAKVSRRTGICELLDVFRVNRLTFDEQCSLIEADWSERFHDDAIVIESDAAQQVWTQHLRATTRVPVMSHDAQAKRDFKVGVPGLLIKLETGRWRFPMMPGSYHQEHLSTFFTEAEAFGWNDDKLEGVGEHDDTVMCWWHLDWLMGLLAVPPPTPRERQLARIGRREI